MNPHLSIEATSHDLSEIGIVIEASNDRFSGTVHFWMNLVCSELLDLASTLVGFPETLDQVVEWEYGFTGQYKQWYLEHKKLIPTLEPSIEYVHFKFVSLDAYGHLAVDITIHEDPWFVRDQGKGRVFLEVEFEPAQLDSFLRELRDLVAHKEGMAVLQGRQPSALNSTGS